MWVVDIIEQAGSAIDEAHRSGIVHRDLPAETWLEPNRRGGFTVKVLDFGLVKLSAAEAKVGAVPVTASVTLETRPEPASETSGGAPLQTIRFQSTSTKAEPPALVESDDKEEAVTLVQEPHSEHGIATMQLPAVKATPVFSMESENPPSLTRAGSIMGTPEIVARTVPG